MSNATAVHFFFLGAAAGVVFGVLAGAASSLAAGAVCFGATLGVVAAVAFLAVLVAAGVAVLGEDLFELVGSVLVCFGGMISF